MHLPFRNGPQRVLQWNAEANGCAIAQNLLGEIPVDQAPTRSAFLLQLIERRHVFAIVFASHPYGDDLNLLRQFMHQLENAPPVVLVLADCPYAMVGLEKEFFAVVQVEESLGELSQVLNSALKQGISRQSVAQSEEAGSEIGESNHRSDVSHLQELTRAMQMPIVNISGELGTGKTLLARLLHQRRGGIDQACFTFYCGQRDSSVVASIEDLLQRSPTASTIMLRDPSIAELSKIARIFSAAEAGKGGTANQLIVLSESGHQLESLFSLRLAPLRDRTELIPELVAATLTGFANSLPHMQIEIQPAGISFLQNYHWPGNVCELNLALTGSLLVQAMKTGTPICLTPQSLRAALLSDGQRGSLSRRRLRNELNELCDSFAKCGWGAGQALRQLLNQVLLRNACLAWQLRPREKTQMDQNKKAA